jgi:hypothetical protein
VNERRTTIILLKVSPQVDNVRSDPRYLDFAKTSRFVGVRAVNFRPEASESRVREVAMTRPRLRHSILAIGTILFFCQVTEKLGGLVECYSTEGYKMAARRN